MQLKNILYAAALALVAAGCNQVDFKKTKGGMPYKLFASKSGRKITEGSFVKAEVIQKIKDSTVFNTYESLPVYFKYTPTGNMYDISELFPNLKEGDSVYAVQVMDTFLVRNPQLAQQTNWKKGDKITTSLKIVKVFANMEDFQKDEAAEKDALVVNEEKAVQDYLKKNNIQAQKTGTATYVQILEKGTGTPVDSGKFVRVMYKGQTFGGLVFDTNMDDSKGHTDPLEFNVGVGQMIKGFDEGVQLLNQGGKARIYMPSTLGYGAQPPPGSGIKPFEHLIFDVEVLEVRDSPPARSNMPPAGSDTTRRAH